MSTSQIVKSTPPSGIKAVFLFTLYSLAVLCTAGVIVGYGQLYATLIDSKVYYNLCNTSNLSFSSFESSLEIGMGSSINDFMVYEPFNKTCPAQVAALAKMFNVAASVNVFIQAFGGIFLDLLGNLFFIISSSKIRQNIKET